jgi:short-subunit dehydrogenase
MAVVWITGASSGIGEALAKQYAKQGAKLVLSARRVAELERVKQACIDIGSEESDVLVLPLDVLKVDGMPAQVELVLAQFGRLDVLINNAGISQRSLCIDTDLSTYRTLFEVDVFGQIALTKAVLPIMLKQGAGHIAVTSSVAGKVGVKLRTGYCAAKHAVMGFFDALRAEVMADNIQVSTITPGFIKTDVSVNALASNGDKFGIEDDDIKNGMDVDHCARVIVAKMNKGTKEIVVGKGLSVFMLTLKRFAPKLVFNLVASKKI